MTDPRIIANNGAPPCLLSEFVEAMEIPPGEAETIATVLALAGHYEGKGYAIALEGSDGLQPNSPDCYEAIWQALCFLPINHPARATLVAITQQRGVRDVANIGQGGDSLTAFMDCVIFG